MKFSNHTLKTISIVLAILFLFQNCKVYHTQSVSIENAIQSESNVKVKLNNDEPYYFKKLINEENRIYGVSTPETATTEYLEMMGYEIIKEGNYTKIFLPNNSIKEIHLKNKTVSTFAPILAGIAFLVAIIISTKNNMSVGGILSE